MRADHIALGGELSGHFYVFEDYLPFDDGQYAAAKLLKILSESSRPLTSILDDLPETYTTPLIEIPCADDIKFAVVERLTDAFRQRYEVNTIDGARVSFPHGWAIIRASNTSPNLTFRAEADSPDGLAKIRAEMRTALAALLEIHLREEWP